MAKQFTPRELYKLVCDFKRFISFLDQVEVIEFKLKKPKNIHFALEGKASDIFKGSKKKSKMVKGPRHGRGDGST